MELTEADATFTFTGLDEKPVPSLLRGFSAPVILDDGAEPERLRFLMAHDSDSFVRWDAGQSYAAGLILSGIADGAEASGLVDAFDAVLNDTSLDQAFIAQVLTLPAESYIAQKMDPIDVDHIHQSRHFLRAHLGKSLEDTVVGALPEDFRPMNPTISMVPPWRGVRSRTWRSPI